MIRVKEEILTKQIVETKDVLNVRTGIVNNMVDVRACNKPVERVCKLNIYILKLFRYM